MSQRDVPFSHCISVPCLNTIVCITSTMGYCDVTMEMFCFHCIFIVYCIVVFVTMSRYHFSLWRHNKKCLKIRKKWAYATRFVLLRFYKNYATTLFCIVYLESRWAYTSTGRFPYFLVAFIHCRGKWQQRHANFSVLSRFTASEVQQSQIFLQTRFPTDIYHVILSQTR